MVEASEGGFRGPKRINHVALSVSSDLLSQQGRAELASFFDDVFGWAELDMMTIDGQRMIFSVNSYDRFVFLLADEAPMSCPPGLPGDHFGVQVDSMDELNIVLDRAEAFRAGDDRVEILPYAVEDHTVLKLHAFYVRYPRCPSRRSTSN